MHQSCSSGVSWAQHCILLGFLFFVRGLLLLCFFPPLEGPDEYQHIAYLAYRLEHGERPPWGASVPKSLYADLVANPHATYDWQQTRVIGTRRYKQFYTSTPAFSAEPTIPLYQSQHPPLYYLLAAPLFGAFQEHGGFRSAVYLLRAINIALAAAALVMLLLPLRLVFGTGRAGRLSTLAISLLPMLLVYVCRVSNDALALLFTGIAVLALSGLHRSRRPLLNAALAGICIGAGVWSRMSAFVLLPAALAWFVLLGLRRRLGPKRALGCCAALALAYLAVAGEYHRMGLSQVGTIFPSSDGASIARTGASIGGLLAAAKARDAVDLLGDRFLMSNLWTSGWSFLPPHPIWKWLYGFFLALALGGVGAALMQRGANRGDRERDGESRDWIWFSVIFASANIALVYVHALICRLTYGSVLTPSYYSMPGFPSLLSVAFVALRGYHSRRLWNAGAVLCVFTFLLTEWHSVFFVALPHWTATHDVHVALQRTVATHPLLLSPAAAPGLMCAALSLLCACAASIAGSTGEVEPEEQPGFRGPATETPAS